MDEENMEDDLDFEDEYDDYYAPGKLPSEGPPLKSHTNPLPSPWSDESS